MAWTEQQLADLEAAIVQLSSGTRKVEVSLDFGNGSRRYVYQQTSLPQLIDLRCLMQSELRPKNQSRSFSVRAKP